MGLLQLLTSSSPNTLTSHKSSNSWYQASTPTTQHSYASLAAQLDLLSRGLIVSSPLICFGPQLQALWSFPLPPVQLKAWEPFEIPAVLLWCWKVAIQILEAMHAKLQTKPTMLGQQKELEQFGKLTRSPTVALRDQHGMRMSGC